MPSQRTLKRRRQRKAHKARIAAWRAKWAAMSLGEQQEFRERRKRNRATLREVNRIALEYCREAVAGIFKPSPLMQELRGR